MLTNVISLNKNVGCDSVTSDIHDYFFKSFHTINTFSLKSRSRAPIFEDLRKHLTLVFFSQKLLYFKILIMFNITIHFYIKNPSL